MGALRRQVGLLTARGAFTGVSLARDVLGWFDGDSLALASGPPAERVRLVLALLEAGVVELLGPGTAVEADEDAGLFRASSAVTGREVSSEVLLETRMSKGKVPDTDDPLLRALLDSPHEVVGVLTRPDAPVGRRRVLTPSPVAVVAEEARLPVLKADRLRGPEGADALQAIRALEADVAVVVAYGALVPAEALQIPRHGWLNLHFSALPAYRGAAPVQRAVMAGETEIAADVFQLEEGLDTGPVFARLTRPVAADETAGAVLTDLAERGGPLVIDVLDRGPGIPQGSEQRIFDRFARGETSDRTGGSGLGLAIVKGFSQAMGFSVEAARRQRGGSRFTIRMPPEAIVQISMEDIA